jgi:hypothetical protein
VDFDYLFNTCLKRWRFPCLVGDADRSDDALENTHRTMSG